MAAAFPESPQRVDSGGGSGGGSASASGSVSGSGSGSSASAGSLTGATASKARGGVHALPPSMVGQRAVPPPWAQFKNETDMIRLLTLAKLCTHCRSTRSAPHAVPVLTAVLVVAARARALRLFI
jgi:hypothetical protein